MPNAPFLAPERDAAWKLGRGKPSGGNQFYTLPGVTGETQGTGNLSQNLDTYGLIFVESPVVVDQLAFEVTTLSSGKNARVGLYAADTDWQPVGAPLADSGDISLTTTGVKTYSPTAFVLNRGRYLTVINNNDNTGTVVFRIIRGFVRSSPLVDTLGSGVWAAIFQASRAYAAFPSPGTAWATVTGSTVSQNHYVVLRTLQP